MAEIRVKDNESLDSALRRFKRQCARAGVLNEVRPRSLPLSVKRNPKLLANANTDKLYQRHREQRA